MKFILILILFFFINVSGYAQFKTVNHRITNNNKENRFFQYGIFVGAGNFSYNLEVNIDGTGAVYEPLIDYKSKIGFSLGVFTKFRLYYFMDLVVESQLLQTERTIFFNNPNITQQEDRKRIVPAMYLGFNIGTELHMPRYSNYQLYVFPSIAYLYNIVSEEHNKYDNGRNVFRTTTNNLSTQMEIGVHMYGVKYIFTPFLKGIFFLNNEVIPDEIYTHKYWAGGIEKLQSVIFLVGIKIQ